MTQGCRCVGSRNAKTYGHLAGRWDSSRWLLFSDRCVYVCDIDGRDGLGSEVRCKFVMYPRFNLLGHFGVDND